MNPPSKSTFRILAILGVALYLLSAVIAGAQVPEEFQGALDWQYFGALLPLEVLHFLWNAYIGLYLIFSLFFVAFFSWARWALLALMILAQVLMLVSGVYVDFPITYVIASISSFYFWTVFILSFFKPCSSYFSPKGPWSQTPTSEPPKR